MNLETGALCILTALLTMPIGIICVFVLMVPLSIAQVITESIIDYVKSRRSSK